MAGRLNALDMWWLIPPAESVGSSKTVKNKSKSPSVRRNNNSNNSANSKNTRKKRSKAPSRSTSK